MKRDIEKYCFFNLLQILYSKSFRVPIGAYGSGGPDIAKAMY